MCRAYHSQGKSYIRLCYRKGARRGQHVYFKGQPPIGPSGHYLDPKEPQKPRAPKESARRCLGCGSPALSRHDQFCQTCRENKPVRKRKVAEQLTFDGFEKKNINVLNLKNGQTYYQMTIFDYLGDGDKNVARA